MSTNAVYIESEGREILIYDTLEDLALACPGLVPPAAGQTIIVGITHDGCHTRFTEIATGKGAHRE